MCGKANRLRAYRRWKLPSSDQTAAATTPRRPGRRRDRPRRLHHRRKSHSDASRCRSVCRRGIRRSTERRRWRPQALPAVPLIPALPEVSTPESATGSVPIATVPMPVDLPANIPTARYPDQPGAAATRVQPTPPQSLRRNDQFAIPAGHHIAIAAGTESVAASNPADCQTNRPRTPILIRSVYGHESDDAAGNRSGGAGICRQLAGDSVGPGSGRIGASARAAFQMAWRSIADTGGSGKGGIAAGPVGRHRRLFHRTSVGAGTRREAGRNSWKRLPTSTTCRGNCWRKSTAFRRRIRLQPGQELKVVRGPFSAVDRFGSQAIDAHAGRSLRGQVSSDHARWLRGERRAVDCGRKAGSRQDRRRSMVRPQPWHRLLRSRQLLLKSADATGVGSAVRS